MLTGGKHMHVFILVYFVAEADVLNNSNLETFCTCKLFMGKYSQRDNCEN